MSESEQDEAVDAAATDDEASPEEETPETEQERTARMRSCQRCGREQGLVGKYDIWLCRQCFREIARGMGFKKYS